LRRKVWREDDEEEEEEAMVLRAEERVCSLGRFCQRLVKQSIVRRIRMLRTREV
jgi:hypothetical protein